MARRFRVCVIFGGQSPEHEVSRVSAASIIENLDKDKYRIFKLGITKKGEWFLYCGKTGNISDGSWEKDTENLTRAVVSPSPVHKGLLVPGANGMRHIKIDVFFPVLHGTYGEDGTIQGIFEMANLKYVGCGVLASAIGMNKIYAKIAFANAGLPQTKWMHVDRHEFERMDLVTQKIEESLAYPLFVKPANSGSSIGISRAADRETLINALHLAAKYDRQIVIEEAVVGREVECSVLGNYDARASIVGEIISADGFYDYKEKYQTNTAKLCIPADLPEQIAQVVRKRAVQAFRAIDGQGLARVDFFVRSSDNEVLINEINTLPGFTSISMYPKLWEATGIMYPELLDRLIELALNREK